MAERATDLKDIRDRVVAEVLGLPEPGVPRPERPIILLATDLAPSDTAGLDSSLVLGLVTQLGGPTSHTAIIARQLGIRASSPCPAWRRCPTAPRSWWTAPPHHRVGHRRGRGSATGRGGRGQAGRHPELAGSGTPGVRRARATAGERRTVPGACRVRFAGG